MNTCRPICIQRESLPGCSICLGGIYHVHQTVQAVTVSVSVSSGNKSKLFSVCHRQPKKQPIHSLGCKTWWKCKLGQKIDISFAQRTLLCFRNICLLPIVYACISLLSWSILFIVFFVFSVFFFWFLWSKTPFSIDFLQRKQGYPQRVPFHPWKTDYLTFLNTACPGLCFIVRLCQAPCCTISTPFKR